MTEPSKVAYRNPADWEAAYREGTPPWDSSAPKAALIAALDEYRLRPQTVLEIGCGTGADAILLARHRFEVTAVDCSAIALERARVARNGKTPPFTSCWRTSSSSSVARRSSTLFMSAAYIRPCGT